MSLGAAGSILRNADSSRRLIQRPYSDRAQDYLRRRGVLIALLLEVVAEGFFFAADNLTSSSRLNIRRRLVPTSRNSTWYHPFIRSTW